MALDEALMARARRTGDTAVRVYGWSAPTLSFGRHQRARGAFDADVIARDGIDVVRRPTGGRALLHHRELTYSVTAPVAPSDGVRAAYARINALLLDALACLGVPAQIAEPAGVPSAPTALPCFAEPASGELMVDGRKLVGSAQWRHDGALVQHGSILVDDDQAMIPQLMHGDAPRPARPATLRELLGREPSLAELLDALAGAVRRATGVAPGPLHPDSVTQREASELARHYRDPAWTWRR